MLNYLKKIFFRNASLENPSNSLNSLNAWTGTPALSGVTINEETALTYSAVFSAINRISTDVASLSLQIYETLSTGGKTPAVDHPCYDLIHTTPDGVLSSYRFRQTLMSHVLSYGNGFGEVIRNNAGVPVRLHLMPPNQVRPEIVNDQLVYRWQSKDGLKIIPFFNVVHVAGMGFDGIQGYSPIKMCRESIGLGLAAETFGASFFGNAARPAGVLTSTKELKTQARKNLRESWQSVQGGPYNAGNTALLEDGVTWSAIGIPPEDAQYLETRRFQVEEVARIYSLPPHKIGDYSRATFSNIEESDQDYIETSLRSWCESLEGELNLKLLTKPERKTFFIKHDFNAFLRANSKDRSAYYQVARQQGWLCVDEIRAEEGLNPLPNGEGQIYLSPLNMQPTTFVLQHPDAEPATPSAPAPLPPAPQQPTENHRPDDDDEEDDERNEAVRAVVVDSVNRLLRREITAVRRAAGKPDFRKFVDEFYADHEANIVEQLTPTLRAFNVVTKSNADVGTIAKDWCQESRMTLGGIEEVTTGEQRGQVIEETLTEWEAKRATKLFGASCH